MPGGGGGGDQTQTTEPWGAQKPYLKDIMQQAQNWYEGDPAQYYPGQTVVPATPNQLQGAQRVSQYSQGTGQQMADNLAQQQAFLSGQVLDPHNNPYLAAYGRAAIQPLMNEWATRVMPAIDQQAVAAGGVGDTRHGVAQGIASQALQEGISQTLAPIYSQAYGQGLDAYVKNLALAPQSIQAGSLPGQIQAAVGTAEQAQGQAERNADIERWNFQQNQPLQRLFDYRNLVQGQYGGQSTLEGGAQGGGFVQHMGGAMTGAAIGSSIMPGVGTAAGAGAGLLLSLLSG